MFEKLPAWVSIAGEWTVAAILGAVGLFVAALVIGCAVAAFGYFIRAARGEDINDDW